MCGCGHAGLISSVHSDLIRSSEITTRVIQEQRHICPAPAMLPAGPAARRTFEADSRSRLYSVKIECHTNGSVTPVIPQCGAAVTCP